MQPIVVHAGDDRPSIFLRVLDQDSGCFADLSSSAIVLIAKFRLRNATTILQAVRCTKVNSGLDGLVQFDWPSDALDVAAGRYEIEVSISYSSTTGSITAATAANPVAITSAAHGLATGDIIHIDSVAGMTELNHLEYVITKIDANSFSLDTINGTAFTAYTSGGTWTKPASIQTGNRYYLKDAADDDDDTLPIRVKDDFA